MIATSTEVQNNFGKYIELSSDQEIIITRNGLPVARLVGIDKTINFLSDRLVGLIPHDIDENEVKEGRLAKQ